MTTRRVRAFLGAVDTIAEGLNNQMFAAMYKEALRSRVEDKDSTLFSFLSQLERTPVGIDEFIDGTEFLGATDFRLWPEVRKAVREMNANWWKPLGEGAYNEAVLCGATGTGKCLAKGTPVVMHDGSIKPVEDVRVGDRLLGPDSTPRNVVSLAQGREEMFTVHQKSGDSYTVNKSHILSLRVTGMGVGRDGDPKRVWAGDGQCYQSGDIVDISVLDYLKSSSTFKHVAKGWKSGPVEFADSSATYIDPYFLGLWLGDGNTDSPSVTTNDPEIAGFVRGYAQSLGLRVNVYGEGFRCPTYHLTAGRGKENPLIEEMHSVGLLRREKFIPESYLTASVAQRWQLLSGIIDSDGYRDNRGYEITTKIDDLRDGILRLARSLGLAASSTLSEKKCQTGGGGMYHRIVLSGDFSCLTVLLDRKRPVERAGQKDVRLTGIEVVPAGEGDYYGFEIDGDRRFLLGDFTVTHNTSIAIVTILYHLYLLSCMKNPQGWYGFPKATSIVFAIMGAKPRVVNKVIYLPMRKLVESMPYFQKYMPPDKLLESEMYFPDKNIRVAQSGVDEDSLLGEAIIGGIIDEINFMNIVLRSKKAEVTSGRAGMYDQAEQVFSTMQRRKRGRFTRPGPCIGIVIPSSSTRYKGDFTDKRRQFVVKNEIKTAYVYSPKQYEVVPQERFSGRTFRLVIGNDVYHDTRVLRDDEATPEGAWVENVPIEYIDDFLNRPYDALRDVLGISNNAVAPFIKSRHKIYECVEAGKDVGLQSILVRDHVILGEHGMPQVKAGTYCMNPSRPRFVHIDLSRNADRAGIAMLRFEGMREVKRQNGMTERLPVATVELACTITPDANNEIDVAEVRAFVKHLRMKYGYPIKAVSYDGVDSRESIQAWRKDGMRAAMVSVDRSSAPYKQLRDAMYDTRILLPEDDLLVSEIIDLEYDEGKDKVDHPVNGSKDLSDAVCGAYTNMLERKSTWTAAAVDDANYEESQRAVFDSRFDAPRSA